MLDNTKDILQGKWKQLRGKVKATWGDITDDELDKVEGNRDMLVGLLQEKSGKTKREIEQQLDNLIK